MTLRIIRRIRLPLEFFAAIVIALAPLTLRSGTGTTARRAIARAALPYPPTILRRRR